MSILNFCLSNIKHMNQVSLAKLTLGLKIKLLLEFGGLVVTIVSDLVFRDQGFITHCCWWGYIFEQEK